MEKIKVLSVNISEKKGTIKIPVNEISMTNIGVEGDAHSGKWHRQVSMLAQESIEKFSKQSDRKINFGEFAENITTQGIELHTLNIFDRFKIGEVLLELTQIGKECHGTNCAIYKEVGNCVMPKEGIFCRVLKNGIIKAQDEIIYIPKVYKIAIITLSDRASKGEYADKSGPKIQNLISSFFTEKKQLVEFDYSLIPDDAELLSAKINELISKNVDVIFTTGGTGIGSRDFTIDVVKPFIEKEIPGIMDFIRFKYGSENPNALISNAVAGVKGKTMIFTLPGSVKAVNEYIFEITKVLNHLFLMLNDIDSH
jgi:molybdenum cofactor synthesis domain-containing protein